MKNLRGLVIGSGSIATRHFSAVQRQLPNGRHLRIASRSFSALASGAGKSDDFKRLISSIDFAIVASPASNHFHHASLLITAQKPLLLEKPLATSLTDAIALEKMAAKSEVLMQVGYQLRHSKAFASFKQAIEKLGATKLWRVESRAHSFLPDWRPAKDYRDTVSAVSHLGGGVLLELSHELDYCHGLLGSYRLSRVILDSSDLLEVGVETSAQLWGTTRSGVSLSISLDMANHKVERWCKAEGESGWAEWDILSSTVTSQFHGNATSIEKFNEDPDVLLENQLAGFLEQVVSRRALVLETADAVAVIGVIEQARTLGADTN